MSHQHIGRPPKIIFLLLAAASALLLSIGWWTGNQRAVRMDAEMRARLLRQATEIAGNINPSLIRKLSFTAADVNTPAYEQLREQMIKEAKQIPNARWVYSMTERGNQIIFGPDSVALNDPQYTPPGDTYQKPPEELWRTFKQTRQITVGPYTDEWGTFVSAFAPVIDPSSGRVLAVIRIDIKAGDWQSSLSAARHIPYLGTLVLLLMLLFTGGVIAAYWRNRRRKPDVLKLRVWITVPTAMAILTGLALYGAYEYWEFKEASRTIMLHTSEQAQRDWNRNLALHVQLMKAQSSQIAENPALLKAWQKRDVQGLTALAQPIFEQLKREYGITHFYFINPDRTCFQRIHQPGWRDDIINREILLAAQRTGENAWGIDMGTKGSLTLRYVLPWKQDGKLIGYLELGIETAHLIRQLSVEMNLDILIVVRKECTSQTKFEAGRQMFEFSGQWNAYPDFVVVHQTSQVMSEEMADWIKQHPHASAKDEIFTVKQGGKIFACSLIRMPDTAGREMAYLIVLLDVTAEENEAWSNLMLSMGLALALFGGVLVLLWSISGTAERQLRKAFAEVKESETRFRQMADSAPVIIWMSGLNMGCTYVNKTGLEFTGHSMEQDCGSGWTDSIHPDDLLHCQKIYADNFSALQPFRMEYRMRRVDGEYRWLLNSAVPRFDGNGNFLGYIGSCIDITEIKHAEEELVRAKEDWERTFDAVPDLIMLLDKDHRIIRVNRAMAEHIGCLSGQVDCHCYKTVHGLSEPPDFCPFSKMLKSGKGERAEVVEAQLGGTFDISTTPLLNSAGEITGCVHIAHDITRRKLVEDDLRRAMNKAEAANRAKSEFMSTMSHEIRTPLNGILGFSNLLADELPKTGVSNMAKFQEYLRVIDQCGTTLEGIINDVLEISSIEAGQFNELDELFDPAENIRGCISAFEFRAREKNISMEFKPRNLPSKTIGDHRRLKQIIFNLVANAVKFTSHGGVEVIADYANNELRITVKDTGIGIPKDKLANVMLPFYQADQSATRKYGGTGLGLTIVSRLLQKLGGTINIESELNKGTAVTVNFPARMAEAQCAEPEPPEIRQAGTLQGLNVLVVEDEPSNMMYLDKILEDAGAQRWNAASFAAMRELCLTGMTPDVVLIDISLPDSDGFECLRWLRQKFTGQQTKYIVQTAHVLLNEIPRYKAAGFDDFIGKPYTRNEMIEIIIKNVNSASGKDPDAE